MDDDLPMMNADVGIIPSITVHDFNSTQSSASRAGSDQDVAFDRCPSSSLSPPPSDLRSPKPEKPDMEETIILSSPEPPTPSSRKRKKKVRADPCADPDMVEAMRVVGFDQTDWLYVGMHETRSRSKSMGSANEATSPVLPSSQESSFSTRRTSSIVIKKEQMEELGLENPIAPAYEPPKLKDSARKRAKLNLEVPPAQKIAGKRRSHKQRNKQKNIQQSSREFCATLFEEYHRDRRCSSVPIGQAVYEMKVNDSPLLDFPVDECVEGLQRPVSQSTAVTADDNISTNGRLCRWESNHSREYEMDVQKRSSSAPPNPRRTNPTKPISNELFWVKDAESAKVRVHSEGSDWRGEPIPFEQVPKADEGSHNLRPRRQERVYIDLSDSESELMETTSEEGYSDTSSDLSSIPDHMLKVEESENDGVDGSSESESPVIIVRRNRSSNRSKAPNRSKALTREEVDDRYDPEVLRLVEGVWMVPVFCTRCTEVRQFCDRNLPCSRCRTTGKQCVREWDELVPARRRIYKKGNKQVPPERKFKSARLRQRDDTLQVVPWEFVNETPEIPGLIRVKQERDATVKQEKSPAIKQEKVLEEPQAHKPECIGTPQAWSETRQELCESLPYYRAYQSGCYSSNGLVHGYLLDSFGSPRDYIDHRVIVSHSGGKSTTDAATGIRKLSEDQLRKDPTIKAMLNNLRQKFPIIAILGSGCAICPGKIPHRYCVMDYFKVTHAWAEPCMYSKRIRWKFRFEKLDDMVPGWWAAKDKPLKTELNDMVEASCKHCKESSPHIYLEGWMCVNPDCDAFWKLGGNKVTPTVLGYTESFINAHTSWPEEYLTRPAPLRPLLNSAEDHFYDGRDVARVGWKGMCCPQCGRLSCREFWSGWVCANKSCDFRMIPASRTILEPARLQDPHRTMYTGPAVPQNLCSDDINISRVVMNGMTVMQYRLGECGTVTHILGNHSINSSERNADWMLRKYQDKDLPFQRHPMDAHQTTGRLLTQQFSFNCGVPYKYLVKQDTMSFEEAPEVVNRALEIIHERVRWLYPHVKFNEILNVGYFENQRMSFHDDGEIGLGPIVASISLGCAARMKFRIKNSYRDDPAAQPDAGRVTHDFVQNEEVLDADGNPASVIRVVKDTRRVKLDLGLNHGDIMIMEGDGIQQYWEHSVIPSGLFRVAVTARTISAENVNYKTPNRAPKALKAKKPTPIKAELSDTPIPTKKMKIKMEPGVQKVRSPPRPKCTDQSQSPPKPEFSPQHQSPSQQQTPPQQQLQNIPSWQAQEQTLLRDGPMEVEDDSPFHWQTLPPLNPDYILPPPTPSFVPHGFLHPFAMNRGRGFNQNTFYTSDPHWNQYS